MSRGVNSVTIIGNLGQEPEIFKANSGATITSISVATSESWKNRETGVQESKTTWHKIKFFGKLADIAQQYLHKGSKVYIQGKLHTEEYEKNGEKRYATVIIAQQFQMLDSRPEGAPQQQNQQQAPQQQPQQQQQGQQQSGGFDDFDDSIPF